MAGDTNREGHDDLLARDYTGRLWIYRGDGHGRYATRKLIGAAGWSMFPTVLGIGDVDLDGQPDIQAAGDGDYYTPAHLYFGRPGGAITDDGDKPRSTSATGCCSRPLRTLTWAGPALVRKPDVTRYKRPLAARRGDGRPGKTSMTGRQAVNAGTGQRRWPWPQDLLSAMRPLLSLSVAVSWLLFHT